MRQNNEIWLRPGEIGCTRFDVFFDSENATAALFRAEIAPSQEVPAMVNLWPSELIIYGLRGRGIVEAADSSTAVVGAASAIRLAANTRFSWRNELRETWGILCYLSDGRAASFLHSLAHCETDNQRHREAAAYGCEIYLPAAAAPLPAAISALENRIAIPMNAQFSF